MHYYELYKLLATVADTGENRLIPELGLSIEWRNFRSDGARVLPGYDTYTCTKHDISFNLEAVIENTGVSPLDVADCFVEQNTNFRFPIIKHAERNDGTIILLHGLNEKAWDKYLPWAFSLAKKTGKAVVLFPIAFHMNRAPEEWSEARGMAAVANQRGANSNLYTSFVNAAISSRLEQHPQRFFWSGLQTYMDILTLVKDIRRGKIDGLNTKGDVDFMAYSIGVYFTLILLMADTGGLFSASRLFAFCGGATMDRMYPSSRYIMDYNAAEAMHEYFSRMVNDHFKEDERLAHYMGDEHKGVNNFKKMLLYHHYIDEREESLMNIAHKIKAVVLKKDTIIPPVEVINTLNGRYREIPASIDVMDFDYPYSHVTPFSVASKYAEQVDKAFEDVMVKAADFLKS